jgi:hypothetical protein
MSREVKGSKKDKKRGGGKQILRRWRIRKWYQSESMCIQSS